MSRVTISADFLGRVYRGPDPAGFAQFIGRLADSPDGFVYAEPPDTLAALEIRPALYELGRIAYGHFLTGSWSALALGLALCQAKDVNHFLYPVMLDNPRHAQLVNVLCGRYAFKPHHMVLMKELPRCTG